MTGNEYQELAARTMNEELLPNQTILHALHGMSAEVGEINSLYQKIYQGHKLDIDHVFSECGDLIWFIAELCTAYDRKLDDVMQNNIIKLQKRYPEGFNEEKSLNRTEGDI